MERKRESYVLPRMNDVIFLWLIADPSAMESVKGGKSCLRDYLGRRPSGNNALLFIFLVSPGRRIFSRSFFLSYSHSLSTLAPCRTLISFTPARCVGCWRRTMEEMDTKTMQ